MLPEPAKSPEDRRNVRTVTFSAMKAVLKTAMHPAPRLRAPRTVKAAHEGSASVVLSVEGISRRWIVVSVVRLRRPKTRADVVAQATIQGRSLRSRKTESISASRSTITASMAEMAL